MEGRRKRPRAGAPLHSLAVALSATGSSVSCAPLPIMSVQETTTRSLGLVSWCTCHPRSSSSSSSRGSNHGRQSTASLPLIDKMRRVIPFVATCATPSTWFWGSLRVSVAAAELRPFWCLGRARFTTALATSSECCPDYSNGEGGVSGLRRKTVENEKGDCRANEGEEHRKRTRELDELHRRQRRFTVAMTELGKNSEWRSVKVLIAEAGRVGLPLNVICLNAAMSVFARSGRWFEALELLTMMRNRARLRDVVGVDDQSGLLGEPPPFEDSSSSLLLPGPDVITYNAAINACGRGKRWKLAVELLKTMRTQGLVPDTFSYSAAISACKNCGRWEEALQLLSFMQKSGLGRDMHCLNAAIAACASAGRWHPAMEILREMETTGPKPDVFSYSSVIDAMAKGGKLDMVLTTLHEMRTNPARFPMPNTVCYNVVLKALSYEGRWREARALLRDVAKGSLESGTPELLDYLSYNAVIRGCAAAGEVGEAFKTRNEMQDYGIHADAFTYEALLAACGIAGDWKAAEAMLLEMRGSTGCVEPPNLAWRSEQIVNVEPEVKRDQATAMRAEAGKKVAIAEAGATAAQVALVERFSAVSTEPCSQRQGQIERRRERIKEGVKPTPRVFHGVMEAYARAGEWQRALNCLEGMRRGSACGGKLGDCSDLPLNGSRDWAEEGGRVGLRAGFSPDATSWGWAIQACAAAGQWKLALEAFSALRSEGVRPGQLCFDTALLACARGGQGSRALSLLSEMTPVADLSDLLGSSPQHGADGVSNPSTFSPRGTGPGMLTSDNPVAYRGLESYKLCMEACRRGGNSAGALLTLSKMRAEGLEPDLGCFNEALKACSQLSGLREHASILLEEMQLRGIVPNTRTT